MKGSFEYLPDASLEEKAKKALNYFWIGFIIYTAVWAMDSALVKNYSISLYIQFIGSLMFIPAAITLIKFRIENTYLKIFFLFYCIWLFAIILRSPFYNFSYLRDSFFNSVFGIFPYLVPLILLFPQKSLFL